MIKKTDIIRRNKKISGKHFALFVFLLVNQLILGNEQLNQQKTDTGIVGANVVLPDVEILSSRSKLTSSTRPIYAVMNHDEIIQLPIKTIADVIKYLPGVDIRERGASGVQADITIRGGTGNQIKILINGIDITDPQTEHYSMNIPIDPMIIDRIEILEGTHFSLTAFCGVINIVTSSEIQTDNSRFTISGKLAAGEYGLINPALAVKLYNKKNKPSKWNINSSASYNHSSGYSANTDYHILNYFLQTKIENIDFQIGTQMKNAGANNFYSTLYPFQFDKTRMAFTSIAYEKTLKKHWNIYCNAYYRTHYDWFELFRDGKQPDGNPAPDWYTPNKHWTHVTGGHIEIGWSNQMFAINLGTNMRNETVHSSNLGNHNRIHLIYFTESTLKWKKVSLSMGINGIWNSQFGHDWSMGACFRYKITKSLNLFISGNRSIRVPTFTDLYYSAPNLRADQNMHPEKAWQLTLTTQFKLKQWYATFSTYHRRGHDIIDWIKSTNPDSTIWFATNHKSVNATGIEITAGIQQLPWINKIEVNYTFCSVNANNDNMLSTYALDYLKHKLVILLDHKIYKGFGAAWCLTWKTRNGKFETSTGIKTYKPVFILDGNVYWQNQWLKISLEVKNITNKSYYDYAGIKQPKHWISGAVEFKL